MIGIDGQYIYIFSLGDQTDFLIEEDLERFFLLETCGNTLPYFEMTFFSDTLKLEQYLNEGTPLKVEYGQSTESKTKIARLNISNSEVSRSGDQKHCYRLSGVLDTLPYLNNTYTYISSKDSGISELMKIAKKYFTVKSNISGSSDSQNWIQWYISDRRYINHLWFHSWLGSSTFLGLGISAEGTLHLYDIAARMGESEKHTFNNIGEGIKYLGDIKTFSKRSFKNSLGGYKRRLPTWTIEDDLYEIPYIDSLKPMLAQATAFDRLSSVFKGSRNNLVLTENMHKNYWKALFQNLQGNLLFSSHGVKISLTEGIFYDMTLFDPVMLIDDQLNLKQESKDQHSGKYLISRISRTVANRKCYTTVCLSRENFNSPKGALS